MTEVARVPPSHPSPNAGHAENRPADRSLLYATMALKVGFITDNQLVQVMQAWAVQQQTSVEKILVQLGFMSEEYCDLLNSLVEAVIRKNAGDPGRSIRSLSPIGPVRDGLVALNAPNLRDSVENLQVHGESDDTDRTLPWSKQTERFRVLRFHRQGGLGKVSVALDTELGREVAFKEILDKYADTSTARDRFMLEAEITGRLEHPGIVPVYGLGHFPDGRPFYAMRFIRGDSFKSAVEKFHKKEYSTPQDRRSDFRRLLERFLDVCDAVEYAHSRGVLHRDLKPGNIMLGSYGETLVVDWGLAKGVGRKLRPQVDEEDTIRPQFGSSAASVQGVAIGSPKFMSPEQAKGQLDKLGPATDVFGLGATLYYLLTGFAPYDGVDELDVLAKAKEARFPSPEERKPDIPSTLVAICCKAMAGPVEERYPSAAALRDDLWKWLADEPISGMMAAVRHFEELQCSEPNRVEFQTRLARELTSLSKVYQSLDRLNEAVKSAERAVAILDTVYSRDRVNLHYFQELFYARSQLCFALRSIGKTTEAEDIEVSNQERFRHLIESLPRTEKIRDEIISLTLHQGFSVQDAEKLLEGYVVEGKSEMQPQDIRLADTIGDVTEGEPGCYQMPASVDSANRYSLISVLGEGGLGIVYRAKDNLLPREVAVKIGRVNDADVGRHILREASILTLLDHPNITPVYDSGYHRQREPPVAETNKGFPFFVMKLVVGKDLRVLSSSVESDKRRKRDRWTQLLRAFADVCRAVQHAHDRGVVHGDPKPMNIIVDIDHRPWLIDWGLSRVIDPARLQSTARDWLQQADNGLRDLVLEPLNFGGIIGTPSYMSPEQARGEGLSEETDIYVLGATLFTILTGELPFSLKGGDFRSFLGSLLADKRPRPRDVDSSIPRKLEAICMKAMARDPKERHANAAQLAEDIRSWVP